MNAKDYFISEGEAAYNVHGRACVVCGEPATQLGHGIPVRANYLDRYGWRVINSRWNRFPVCNLACNHKVQKRTVADIDLDREARDIMAAIVEEGA
jgi:hypothetical protein